MTANRPSFRSAFREAHPMLKVTFSASLIFVCLAAVELICFCCLAAAGNEPNVERNFSRRLSGYAVFKRRSNYMMKNLAPTKEEREGSKTDAQGLGCDEPVTFAKPAGVTRIILTGGSALAGSGQLRGRGYEDIHPYDVGGFAYAEGVAGHLERALQRLLPERRFQVINAAYYQKTLHQSLLHYVELLSRYSPDYVVNVDGYNDQELFFRDPYAVLEAKWLGPYVTLYGDTERDGHVLSTTALLARLQGRRPSLGPPRNIYGQGGFNEAPGASVSVRARRWLQVLEHYMAVIERDGGRLLFTLQPQLNRKTNKALSDIESKFRDLEPLDTKDLALWGELSAELRRRVETRGFLYLDLCEEIRDVGADVELYTDYCHLTPEGNAIVAERLARALGADLRRRSE